MILVAITKLVFVPSRLNRRVIGSGHRERERERNRQTDKESAREFDTMGEIDKGS
jgi:hypothetical protein